MAVVLAAAAVAAVAVAAAVGLLSVGPTASPLGLIANQPDARAAKLASCR